MLNTKLHFTISCEQEDKVIRLNCKSNMHVTYRVRKTIFFGIAERKNKIRVKIIMSTTKDSQNIFRFFSYLFRHLNKKHWDLFTMKS